MLEIAITFAYVQIMGWLIRRSLPRFSAQRRSTLVDIGVEVAASGGVTALIIAATAIRPTVFLSSTGAWLSLAFDVLCAAIGLTIYLRWLRLVRIDPGRHPQSVVCYERESRWSARFDLWLVAWGAAVIVPPMDFVRFLRADVRVLNHASVRRASIRRARVDADAARALEKGDLPQFPRLAISGTTARAVEVSTNVFVDRVTNHRFNRALNAALTPDEWRASQALCDRMPSVIAGCWKAFHFQDSARLRLVCLFNTVDLLQRLCAILALASLRATRRLAVVVPDLALDHSSFGQWNRLLEAAVTSPLCPLPTLRRCLAEERDDWDALDAILEPVYALTHVRPAAGTPPTVLTGFRILGDLRNAVLGHGAVGWRVTLTPALYIAALHKYVLALVRDLSGVRLHVHALHYEPVARPPVCAWVGRDRGLDEKIDGLGQCFPYIDMDGQWWALWPYCAFRTTRLLMLNRKGDDDIEYVDFDASATEPSFSTDRVPPHAFIEPRDAPTPRDVATAFAAGKPTTAMSAIWEAAMKHQKAKQAIEALALYQALEREAGGIESHIGLAYALRGQARALDSLGRQAEHADVRGREWLMWIELEEWMSAVAAMRDEAVARYELGQTDTARALTLRALALLQKVTDPQEERGRDDTKQALGALLARLS